MAVGSIAAALGAASQSPPARLCFPPVTAGSAHRSSQVALLCSPCARDMALKAPPGDVAAAYADIQPLPSDPQQRNQTLQAFLAKVEWPALPQGLQLLKTSGKPHHASLQLPLDGARLGPADCRGSLCNSVLRDPRLGHLLSNAAVAAAGGPDPGAACHQLHRPTDASVV